MERVYTTPLLDKLGIRPGMRVALIDIDDPEIRQLIAERTTDMTEGEPETETDVVPVLASRIRPNGAIWVVSRKGKAATLRYEEILDVAKAAGLIDNKVAAFSATHTALRFVIPVALRPKSPAPERRR